MQNEQMDRVKAETDKLLAERPEVTVLGPLPAEPGACIVVPVGGQFIDTSASGRGFVPVAMWTEREHTGPYEMPRWAIRMLMCQSQDQTMADMQAERQTALRERQSAEAKLHVATADLAAATKRAEEEASRVQRLEKQIEDKNKLLTQRYGVIKSYEAMLGFVRKQVGEVQWAAWEKEAGVTK